MQNTFSLINITQDDLKAILYQSVSCLIREFSAKKNEGAAYIDADKLETQYGIKKSQAAKMRMNNELPYYLVKSKVLYKAEEIEEENVRVNKKQTFRIYSAHRQKK